MGGELDSEIKNQLVHIFRAFHADLQLANEILFNGKKTTAELEIGQFFVRRVGSLHCDRNLQDPAGFFCVTRVNELAPAYLEKRIYSNANAEEMELIEEAQNPYDWLSEKAQNKLIKKGILVFANPNDVLLLLLRFSVTSFHKNLASYDTLSSRPSSTEGIAIVPST